MFLNVLSREVSLLKCPSGMYPEIKVASLFLAFKNPANFSQTFYIQISFIYVDFKFRDSIARAWREFDASRYNWVLLRSMVTTIKVNLRKTTFSKTHK